MCVCPSLRIYAKIQQAARVQQSCVYIQSAVLKGMCVCVCVCVCVA